VTTDNEVQIMRDLIEHLGVRDHVVTFVGKQRSDREADVEQFVVDMAVKYPWSRVVVGDTSTIEKAPRGPAT
jgi:hypothetical protein